MKSGISGKAIGAGILAIGFGAARLQAAEQILDLQSQPTVTPGTGPLAQNSSNFIVSNIRVEGLQRISEGTVFNYLPINIGDRVGPERIAEAIRALFATGFFRDIEMRRDGGVLIVAVAERPSLESVDIKGNKDIKTEDLQKSLRNVGLSAGKTFDRSTLDEVTQYLTDQYFSRGKYAVKIDSKVEDLPNNRVRVNIDIKEGSRAKIRQINLIGNTRFTDKEILSALSITTPNITSWYKQTDRYSRESLQGDLEKIQTFYQDHGYANARVENVQVAIAPDKKDIFVTVNIYEGDVYKLGEIKLGGNLIIPESEARKYLLVRSGDTYTHRAIAGTQEFLRNRLGAEGFYFAKVEPVPTIDEATKTVALTMFVDPGSRVYVRHINFLGSTRTNDETLRREMRQLESTWLSNAALERSKQRLQRLPYIESVEMATEPVAGSPDQVDVNYTVKERPSAQIGGGVGYSAYQRLVLNANFNDSDFFGTGKNLGVNIDAGKFNKIYSISETDPYLTIDGLTRTISMSYRDSTQFVAQTSAFGSKNISFGVNFGVPLSEFQAFTVGASLQHLNILTYEASSAQQALNWVTTNGHPYRETAVNTIVEPDGTTISTATTLLGSTYNSVELSAGWAYDSRNRALFANHGLRASLGATYVPPGSNVRYLIGSFQFAGYLPLPGRWTLAENMQIASGHALGNTKGLPPYKRFYAGGPDTIRGFTEDTLGPIDSNGNPYGGNLLAVSQTELIVPLPEKWQTSARGSFFFDMGNVFSTDGTQYLGQDEYTNITNQYKFHYNELKKSAGIAVQWLAPSLGIFRFSYGIPLNHYSGNGVIFPDRTEYFQFSVGQSF